MQPYKRQIYRTHGSSAARQGSEVGNGQRTFRICSCRSRHGSRCGCSDRCRGRVCVAKRELLTVAVCKGRLGMFAVATSTTHPDSRDAVTVVLVLVATCSTCTAVIHARYQSHASAIASASISASISSVAFCSSLAADFNAILELAVLHARQAPAGRVEPVLDLRRRAAR